MVMPSNLFCCCVQGQGSGKEDTRELPGNEVFSRGGSARQMRPPVESTSTLSANGNLNVNRVLGSCLFLTLQPRISHSSGPSAFSEDVYKGMRLPRECIILDDMVSSGWFGNIYKGRIQRPVGSTNEQLILIRELSIRHCSELEKARFLSDLLPHIVLKNHDNILPLLGINTDSLPFLAVFKVSKDLQMPAYIDLREFLLLQRESGDGITNEEAACMAMDIACGLAGLHDRGFVHHDLSTRTCCYIEGRVRIGEIGWSEYKYKEDYFMFEGDVVPLRWLDPYSIRQHGMGRISHSQSSNLWSFAVTLWEILSGCQQPYQSFTSQDLLTTVMFNSVSPEKGGRAGKIPSPGDPYSVMYLIPDIIRVVDSCWKPQEDRPTLSECIQQISRVFHPSRRSSAVPHNRDLGDGINSRG